MLQTNLDDCSGEWIGYCLERLIEAGALDAYCTAIQMKKNRPATELTVLCPAEKADSLQQILFAETGSLGVRRTVMQRFKLRRRAAEVVTRFGVIQGKVAVLQGVETFSPEFDACREAARSQSVSLREVYFAAIEAFRASGPAVETA